MAFTSSIPAIRTHSVGGALVSNEFHLSVRNFQTNGFFQDFSVLNTEQQMALAT